MRDKEISSFEIQSSGKLAHSFNIPNFLNSIKRDYGHFGVHKKANLSRVFRAHKKGSYPQFSQTIKRTSSGVLGDNKKGVYCDIWESIKKADIQESSQQRLPRVFGVHKKGGDLNGWGYAKVQKIRGRKKSRRIRSESHVRDAGMNKFCSLN